MRRDSTYLRQARNFAIEKLVFIGRLPCELPLAILTPILFVGRANHSSSKNAPTNADALLLAEYHRQC
jgi:hypothetical protein